MGFWWNINDWFMNQGGYPEIMFGLFLLASAVTAIAFVPWGGDNNE